MTYPTTKISIYIRIGIHMNRPHETTAIKQADTILLDHPIP